MKTILVPTDYSACADNALQYAIELAKFDKAKIDLLHVYHIPIPTTEVPIVMLSPRELEKENRVRIKKLEEKVFKQIPENIISFHAHVRAGFAVDQILDFVKGKKIDMIVMGMKGSGKLRETLIGSNTTSVMKKATCPVIVVPEKAKFKQIEKIVFACDYEKIKDHSVLEPLWKLAQTYEAEILVFNVKDARVHPSTKEAIEGVRLAYWLGRVKHSYWFAESSNVVEAINDFVKKNQAAIIAVLGHKHPFPENLIHKSTTKNIAFHTNTPILSLHE